MDKKTVSQGVKNLCKPIAIFYGSGILFAVIYYLLDYIGSSLDFGNAFWRFMDFLTNMSFFTFGIFSFYVLVPAIAVLTLIIGGIVYAISERNIKNIFNFPLWATVVLVVLNTVLQLDVMSYMF
jgi:hypothetical protein